MSLYIMEIYDRPEGTGQTVLLEKFRFSAPNDEEAISQARISFVSHDTPSVTGFMLRLPGLRLSDDTIVHEYMKRSGAYALNGENSLEKSQAAAIAAAEMTAPGEEVTVVPPFVGFDR